jgi:hypothetical protein
MEYNKPSWVCNVFDVLGEYFPFSLCVIILNKKYAFSQVLLYFILRYALYM